MTTEQAIKLMQVEVACIERASNADHPCTRECEKCDLLQTNEDLIAAYGMAVSALRAQQECVNPKPQWISVKDRLPEDACFYLVVYHDWSNGEYLPKYDDYRVRVMRFLNNGSWRLPVCLDRKCEEYVNREITHWMPLPEPPKEAQK